MTISRNTLLLPLILMGLLGDICSASPIPTATLDSIWSFSLARLRTTMTQLQNATTTFPRRAPQTGAVWQTVGPGDWVSGFYPGCLWYAYEKTGDTLFRYNARRWTEALYGQRTNTGTHDVGFMLFCSYGNGYRLLRTASYLPVIHTASQSLSTRYITLAGIIDSWSFAPFDTGWEAIIDNMMNLELLFWSAANGGTTTHRTMATSHAEKSMTNHFRPDSSTHHVVRYSQDNGAMIRQETRQGYSNASCWARGQAWAVYGFTMAYRFTRDARFLATARKAADYYLRRLPADRVPFWDFDAPGIPADSVPRDASSSAIVASALLELATFTGAPDSARYRDSAVSLIRGLWAPKYRGLSTQASILNHSTGSRKEGHDVDMGIIYADYYFLEALVRYEKLAGNTAVGPYRVTRSDQIGRQMIVQETFDLLGRNLPLAAVRKPGGVIIRHSATRSVAEPPVTIIPFAR
ncbi:MAG: glycoside hydrolase family 88 protein [Chitinispirillaceae bacterium]|nr:glycoside hydrolase family 88 protein [Chitinispirillaceae bacterium]